LKILTPPPCLANLCLGDDGIWGVAKVSAAQRDELNLREKVASIEYSDYLMEISKHHSINVMDREVEKFIKTIPSNGIILDVGGCWGWHWRNIRKNRPDIRVVIADFVRPNLIHAKKLLLDSVSSSVWLVHADATDLPFSANTFDGYWSVQTLQHIPDLERALIEARKVLKPNGIFASYSLNDSPFTRLVNKVLGLEYHNNGLIKGAYYLRRDTEDSLKIYGEYFESQKVSYTEILFNPELGWQRSGRKGSMLGKIDGLLSGKHKVLGQLARQISIHAFKSASLPPEHKPAQRQSE
jgi:ubiquinone/menaquinone biosynthesis C-methylase UbiE